MGNCMAEAVFIANEVQAGRGVPSAEIARHAGQRSIRRQAVSHLREKMFERVRHSVYLYKTLKLNRDLLPSERITDADVRDYLTHMETDRTWMDQIELEASARALGVCISVWVDCPGAPGFLKFYHLANNELLGELPTN